MKLCNLMINDSKQLGVYIDGFVVNINEALKEYPKEAVPNNLEEVIKNNEKSIQELKNYVKNLNIKAGLSYVYKEEDCQFGPSVSEPEKILCIGLNYQRHADETGASYPEVPILFSKFNNTLTGHNHKIKIPEVTEKLDYEVELAIVIGKTANNVPEEEALNYVFGYTPSNDLSARDLQMLTAQWLLGKTCDDFTPIGPFITTADEIEDPQTLNLKTLVNGEVRQNSNTSDMIFTCAEIVSYISKHITLKPGDVILTGTPEGVVLGLPEEKQVYLKDNDEVTIEIEKLGSLNNKFTS